MRVLCIGIILTFAVSSLLMGEEFDVRKVRWGMTTKQVLRAESWKVVESRPIFDYMNPENDVYRITCKGELLRKECNLMYDFRTGKLVTVIYTFQILDNQERDEFITELATILKEKYGVPNTYTDFGERESSKRTAGES